MIETLYIEENIRRHPRTEKICKRFPTARKIFCGRYGEVFNPKAQNFRLQKQKPALILAEKYNNRVLPAPPGYGIGAQHNYYFSHMLNCVYDCRYCFLQGMYQSAHYVLFVNYEDFKEDISQLARQSALQTVHFFSGYDCDSLALEPVTGFAEAFMPLFDTLPNAWLELRSKSTQVRSLLKIPPVPRCIVAFSLTPNSIAQAIEYKAPSVNKRIEAMVKLQQQGWTLGLRFDPLIYQTGYRQLYQQLFEQVFARIRPDSLHSVSLGVFRLPEKYFKKMARMYPQEKLFAGSLQIKQGMASYQTTLEQEMLQSCSEMLLQFIPESRFFPCAL